MKITIITLFPNMIKGFFEESIIKRAVEKKLVEIELSNLRDFAKDSYGSVDDKPYGGGAGMILKVDVVYNAINNVKTQNSKVVLASAKGRKFDQKKAEEFSKLDHLILIAGHYEGVDERVLDFIDEEISVGDFVLTGGELPAAIIVDSVVRLLPRVLKKEEAIKQESFINVSINRIIETVGEEKILLDLKKRKVKEVMLLEHPQYTRPEEFKGKKVPEILLSGDHKKIEEWRIKKAYEETIKKRLDLLS